MSQPPREVTRAAMSLYGLAALQLVGLVLSFLMTGSAESTIRENDPELTDSEVSTVVTIGLILSSVVTVAIAGVWLLCARKLLAGRSWARILGTALAGLVLLLDVLALTAGTLISGSNGLSAMVTLVGLALAAAYLFFVWSRPASAFFAAAAAR